MSEVSLVGVAVQRRGQGRSFPGPALEYCIVTPLRNFGRSGAPRAAAGSTFGELSNLSTLKAGVYRADCASSVSLSAQDTARHQGT